MEWVSVSLNRANRLINHGPVVLVTSKGPNWDNVMTLAWLTPVSQSPSMVAIAVSKSNLTEELIRGEQEFVINIPGVGLLDKVVACGRVSGREVDKLKEYSLLAEAAKNVRAPILTDCLAYMECQVDDMVTVGDHTLFTADVLACGARPGAFEAIMRVDDPTCKTVHHLGGNLYTIPGDLVDVTAR